MSRKWWAIIISIVVIVGVVLAVKFMPVYATLVSIGSFVVGVFAGHKLFPEIKVEEKTVEVPILKTIMKEIPVEKIVYVDNERPSPKMSESRCEADAAEPQPKQAAPTSANKARKRSRSKKVAE